MSAPTSYDIVPYPSRAYAHSHPDRLFVLSKLFGLSPVAPQRARVLELGCGAGGNLLPIAAHLPDAVCEGYDLSREAIGIARTHAAALGLKNVVLEAADIAELPLEGEPYDYIVCHGVFSWVPEAVRAAILRFCRARLSEQGIAYISYNTFPGWHLHRVARDIMHVHGLKFDDPLEQSQQGKAMIRFMADQAARSNSPYAKVLQQQAEMTRQYSDEYFFHDFLSPDNEPLLLRDFVIRARDAGLAYLGDADLNLMMPAYMPPEVRSTFDRVSGDIVEMEQYLDLLRGTSFRRTLLVRAERAPELRRELRGEDLSGLWVSLCGTPVTENVDLGDESPAEFEAHNDVRVTVNQRIPKAAMMRLVHAHPRSLPFDELPDLARAWTDTDPEPDQERDLIGGVLLHSYAAGLIDLAPRSRGATGTVSERPTADAFARMLAVVGEDHVPNRRHEMVPLTKMDRVLLPMLDGTRDGPALLDALLDAQRQGLLTVQVEGQPTDDNEVIHKAFSTALPDRLLRFARTSLLVA